VHLEVPFHKVRRPVHLARGNRGENSDMIVQGALDAFWLQIAKPMIELPLNQWLIDASHFGRKLTQARAEAFMREEFEALIEESGYACLVLHPRADIGVARAARLEMMTQFLERARGFGVAFHRCSDCAAAFRSSARTAAHGVKQR
jgi:hypothetical protein